MDPVEGAITSGYPTILLFQPAVMGEQQTTADFPAQVNSDPL